MSGDGGPCYVIEVVVDLFAKCTAGVCDPAAPALHYNHHFIASARSLEASRDVHSLLLSISDRRRL